MKTREVMDIFEFKNIVEDIVKNERVQEMKKYRQHCDTSCFEHCYNAAFYSYYICKILNWDYRAVTRAAMLHDFYLYDWRSKLDHTNKWHCFTHANIACKMACEYFKLNEKEKNIIMSHMWPASFVLPKCKEAFLLTLIDKYCALSETIDYLIRQFANKKFGKYAYILLGIVIFNVTRIKRIIF
ncbi:MAG: HD domain-containing protein [Clostridia bacterium]|nr:HD domain-containing protein [Clostridia bacterium]